MKKELYGTRLYVDFSKLERNINYIKSTQKHSKIIAIVKANAYGHGDLQISKKIETLGVDIFAVADFEEGLILRDNGIKSSIMVMNPGINNMATILKNKLEPVIYNYNTLNKLITFSKLAINSKVQISIHIKINTGMNRWGFDKSEVPELIRTIKKNQKIKIISIYSHLSSVENKEDDVFTKMQIKNLKKVINEFSASFDYSIYSHILNSKGTQRFPQILKQFTHSRIGVFLYGCVRNSNLEQVSELRCPIYQIRQLPLNEAVGYNRSFVSKKKTKIGVVPFGYADGLQRNWGNGKLKFYYKGCLLPTVGDISMDSCMVDLTRVKNISIGDEILYFGAERPIWDLASSLNTIPHEILATLSRRIRRVYF